MTEMECEEYEVIFRVYFYYVAYNSPWNSLKGSAWSEAVNVTTGTNITEIWIKMKTVV